MASLNDRLARAREMMPAASPGGAATAPSPEERAVLAEFLEELNAERARIDAEDAGALGNPDLDFGDRPPEPPPEAEQPEPEDEPVSGGGDWYFDMLLDLRAEIADEHHAAESMDIAIAQERKKQQRQKGRNDEEPS